jgi:hypothetical protein
VRTFQSAEEDPTCESACPSAAAPHPTEHAKEHDVKPGKTVLFATITAIALASPALASPALAAASARTGPAVLTFTNPGATSPSLSLSVSPSGEPEVASVGPNGSLWFSYLTSGRWHRTRVGGPGSAFSGPSLYAGPLGFAGIAAEGPLHTLQFFALAGGHWRHFIAAGPGSVYSAPSLAVGTSKAGVAFEGPRHSLVFYSGTVSGLTGHLHKKVINGRGTTYSAPSVVIRGSDQVSGSGGAGQVDIAVQNANHALSYYNSLPGGHWQNDVIGGPGTAYSAPSLTVYNTLSEAEGVPYLVVQGPHHSMTAFADNGSWQKILVAGNGRVYSAPSLTVGDSTRESGMAFEGPSHSVSFYYWYVSGDSWVNDVISSVTLKVDSAPALFFRTGNPYGENDLVFQGKGNTLWYMHAPEPGSPSLAPQFTGRVIAGHGTTFGG